MAEASASLIVPRLKGTRSYAGITDDLLSPLEVRAGPLWRAAFALSLSMLVLGAAGVAYLLKTGVGTWGVNNTIGWGFAITNFVFWIGMGHAGTFISAILFLLRQEWRTSVGRVAETITIFAVLCSALFPLIHLGRPWLAFWMLPYPNFRGPLWVNLKSPLVWDCFAIGSYFLVSLIFWYVGLLPDFGLLRRRLKEGFRKRLSQTLSLGWNGSSAAWRQHSALYALLAGLATALVISVHSIVSFDFAVSLVAGWHSTIFPPYFVTGAIFSGLAMVLAMVLVARKVLKLEHYIPQSHLDSLCKVVVVASWIIGLSYSIELFQAFYSGHPAELLVQFDRISGPMFWLCLVMVTCNVALPQFLWSQRFRRRLSLVFGIALLINLGMWLERYVIVVGALYRGPLPSTWAAYTPTSIEVATLVGSLGFFGTGFLICCRLFPIISLNEVKSNNAKCDPV